MVRAGAAFAPAAGPGYIPPLGVCVGVAAAMGRVTLKVTLLFGNRLSFPTLGHRRAYQYQGDNG